MNLSLPLWIVHPKHAYSTVPPENEPCDSPSHSLGFSTADRLTSFLKSRESGKWQLHLVSDYEDLMELFGDLHQLDVPGVCFDVREDGSGGRELTLADLAFHFSKDRRLQR